MISADDIKEKGIVGAGGAGFPTHVKFANTCEVLIVNAAECEPLLHKDKELLLHKTKEFFEGLALAAELTKAKKVIIGVKGKYEELIVHLGAHKPKNVEIKPLVDFYPTGDEITLIYECTGRLVEAGKLPLTQGCIVSNVETFYNIAHSGPVLTKFLNVAGEVERPATWEVPLGTPVREIIAAAVPSCDNPFIISGGPMMGKPLLDLDEPVTKTLGGLIILPPDHRLAERYRQIVDDKVVRRIGKAACDQCSFCTEMCPRYLLGHPVQPHRSMRSLVFGSEQSATMQDGHALYCCECNLCTLFACPEDLLPSQVTILEKRAAQKAQMKYAGVISNKAHPVADYRRVSVKRLMAKLDLMRFKNEGPLMPWTVSSPLLRILLKQHVGAPSTPLVKAGDKVTRAQKIATASGLGSELHAPLAGTVSEVTERHITIKVG